MQTTVLTSQEKKQRDRRVKQQVSKTKINEIKNKQHTHTRYPSWRFEQPFGELMLSPSKMIIMLENKIHPTSHPYSTW